MGLELGDNVATNLVGAFCDSCLHHIAAADGFLGLGLSRREASWAIKGLRDEALPLFAAFPATSVAWMTITCAPSVTPTSGVCVADALFAVLLTFGAPSTKRTVLIVRA